MLSGEEIFYPPRGCYCQFSDTTGQGKGRSLGGLLKYQPGFQNRPRLLTFLAFRFRPSAVSTLTNELPRYPIMYIVFNAHRRENAAICRNAKGRM